MEENFDSASQRSQNIINGVFQVTIKVPGWNQEFSIPSPVAKITGKLSNNLAIMMSSMNPKSSSIFAVKNSAVIELGKDEINISKFSSEVNNLVAEIKNKEFQLKCKIATKLKNGTVSIESDGKTIEITINIQKDSSDKAKIEGILKITITPYDNSRKSAIGAYQNVFSRLGNCFENLKNGFISSVPRDAVRIYAPIFLALIFKPARC